MSNLSILEQNILLGVESEEGQRLFLKWKDKDWRKAERAAWDLDIIVPFIDWALPLANHVLREQQTNSPHFVGTPEENVSALRAFLFERNVRRYFPKN